MSTEPLGLPKGSVRGILAVSCIVIWAAIVVYSMFIGFDAVKEMGANPPVIVGIVIGYYFGARANEQKDEESEEPAEHGHGGSGDEGDEPKG